MLGPAKARDLGRPVLTSLEALVPASNFYRHLDAQLDLGFVRDWVRERYAAVGRPSVDPVVFFKLQLILFFEGYRSERQLVAQASLNLAHRWYLGYQLDEDLPDHSSLTRIRQRLGLAAFRRFFERVVELCDQAGLIRGKELLADATKVPGNAAVDSLVPRLKAVIDGHLVELFGDQAGEEPPEELPDTGPPHLAAPTPPSIAGEEPEAAARRWDLLETCRLDPDRPLSQGYERTSHRKVSRTDPDATPMAAPDGRAVLGYQAHYLIDGGRARVILHALTMSGDVMENQPFLAQLGRAIFRWKLRPDRVVADGKYGTIENIRALDAMDIKAYVPLRDFEHRNEYFGSSRFAYDAEEDVYRCPQGAALRPSRVEWKAEKTEYQADAAVCNACALKARCTPSDAGRLVHRSFHAEALERVKEYAASAAYQKAIRKRKVWIEPLFAEAKQWHGLRQFRLRGLEKVNIQGLLVATGQNLKRWLAATGWGRRSAPCGSLLAPMAICRARLAPA